MLRNKVIILIIAILIVIGVGYFYFSNIDINNKLILTPQKIALERSNKVTKTKVGTGWSINNDPAAAAREAGEMALAGNLKDSPDFAIIFASSGSNLELILAKLRELWGDKTKIYGGTSDSRGVMTDKVFVSTGRKPYEVASIKGNTGLAIMTVTSQEIVFGVGSANFADYPSSQQAAKAAILQAIRSAGKSPQELPEVVLCTITKGTEEEVLEGLEGVVGKNTPIFGGTAGGPQFGVLGNQQAYAKGISLAVIYTSLPVGWVFEGGFDVSDPHNGIVTQVDGQAIVKIDHRPALEVYDEWLGGEIKRLHASGGDFGAIRTLLNLHPLYRKYVSPAGQEYFLFSHPWPADPTLKQKQVMTSTKIKVGEKIYLSHGTWETLLNRVIELPRKAKQNAEIAVDAKPILGIGYICAGVMGVIPENDRLKMPILLDYANNDAPFIATFTWGEQGFVPGVCNKHANLSTSFIVIGHKK